MSAALAVVESQGETSTDLVGLATLANEAAREYLLAGRRSLECARRAGVVLLQAKRRLGHGKFCDFVVKFCDFSHGTACRFMQVASIPPDKFSTIVNLTVAEALRWAADEAEPRAPQAERDERQAEIFTIQDAPQPADAASRLLLAGGSIKREGDHARRFRLLLQRLDREAPWKLDTEALVGEMDSETLTAIERVCYAMGAWLPLLLGEAMRERADRSAPQKGEASDLSQTRIEAREEDS